MKNRMIAYLASTALAGLTLLPTPTAAQVTGNTANHTAVTTAAPSVTDNTQLQDIVVTAQKRGENLQRVPIAVSVITDVGLARAGVTNIGEIKTAVPALSAANGLGYLQFYLHGIGSQGNGIGFENPVALYIDGVYIASQSVGLFGFNNIAQIEVDKGPQGTLFGRNATGGLIQVTTLEPTQDLHFKSNIGGGNFGAVDGSLYLTGGLGNDLAADISIKGSRRDGWGTNLFNGQDVYGVKHDIAARSKWVYAPGDWKFTFIADYVNTLSSNNATSLVQGSRAGDGTGPVGPVVSYPRKWDTNTNVQPRLLTESGGVSLKIARRIGDIEVSNITAWRKNRFRDIADYDASPVADTGLDIIPHDWQFSNELQVSSTNDGPFKWVGGVYYFKSGGRFAPDGVSVGGSVAPDKSTIPFFVVTITGTQDTEAEAVFAQGSYELSDKLTLTLGARYSFEQRRMEGQTAALNCTLPAAFCPPPVLVPTIRQSTDFQKPTFRAALAYQATPDVLVYASANTGFKSGGYNVTSPAAPPYRQETITAYEGGIKADLLDRKLRVNVSGFYNDYKDIQSQVAGVTSTDFTNGGSAHIYGLDADVTAFPIGDLQVKASLALLHAKFYNFPNATFGSVGGGVPIASQDASGNVLPHAPKATLTVGVTYPVAIGSSKITINGNVFHSSSYFLEPDNIISQPSYTTANGSVEWTLPNARYSVRAYVNNIGNVAVKSVGLTIPSGNQFVLYDSPRTYGVSASYQF